MENEESDASLFSSSFSKLSHSHTKRDDNKVARILARLVVNYLKCTVWMKDVPSFEFCSSQYYCFDLIKVTGFLLKKSC